MRRPWCSPRAGEAERLALLGFAQDFGLAYQILDDLKDHERDARPSRPAAAPRPEKANFVTLLGGSAAQERLGVLRGQCHAHLEAFGSHAAYLRASVDFVLDQGA